MPRDEGGCGSPQSIFVALPAGLTPWFNNPTSLAAVLGTMYQNNHVVSAEHGFWTRPMLGPGQRSYAHAAILFSLDSYAWHHDERQQALVAGYHNYYPQGSKPTTAAAATTTTSSQPLPTR